MRNKSKFSLADVPARLGLRTLGQAILDMFRGTPDKVHAKAARSLLRKAHYKLEDAQETLALAQTTLWEAECQQRHTEALRDGVEWLLIQIRQEREEQEAQAKIEAAQQTPAEPPLRESFFTADLDVDVIERAMLDPAHAARFKKPWLVQEANGEVWEMDTEADACTLQEVWRALVIGDKT